jgi:hypothetical protein
MEAATRWTNLRQIFARIKDAAGAAFGGGRGWAPAAQHRSHATPKPRALNASANCNVTPKAPRRPPAPMRLGLPRRDTPRHGPACSLRCARRGPPYAGWRRTWWGCPAVVRRNTVRRARASRCARRGPARRRLRRTWGPRRLRLAGLLGESFALCAQQRGGFGSQSLLSPAGNRTARDAHELRRATSQRALVR